MRGARVAAIVVVIGSMGPATIAKAQGAGTIGVATDSKPADPSAATTSNNYVAPPANNDPKGPNAAPSADTCTTASCQVRSCSSCDSCSSCSSSCSRSSSCRSCRCGKTPSLSLSVIGLRASGTHVGGPGSLTSDAVGLSFAGSADTHALDGTTHLSMQWVLGGGSAGFEGRLGGVLDFGHRVDVTDTTGPFGRVGFDGQLQGNDKFYFSSLELPRLTLGWQYLDGKVLLEAGARGGPILVGRYYPGEDGYRPTSGSFEYGAFVTAQVDYVRLDGTLMRMDHRGSWQGRPLDIARASFCGAMGKVGICADMMAMRGAAEIGARPESPGGIQETTVLYSGLSIGLVSW